nr:unnamed protein product [Spirometra erinaceieuropaei]
MCLRLQPPRRPKELSKLLNTWLEDRPILLFLANSLPFSSAPHILFSTLLPHGRKFHGSPHRYFQDEASSATLQEATSNELALRAVKLPVAATTEENASVENLQCQLRDTLQSTALAVLGRAWRQHQDWLDGDDAATSNLFAEVSRLHKTYVDRSIDDNRTAFYLIRSLVQPRLREMQDAWTACKAKEIQGYAYRNVWKNFSAIKALYGPTTKGTAPLLSADGTTLLTEKTKILQRWAEHF